jgi:tetratricopeptide (TPR) repeat protein
MPESFGRVESHCFGCERAFAGKSAQSIAEKVFLGLAAKPDAKPQVYYLLGYLRMEQERWEEAADYFTRAATLDPDYLNAWSKLADVLPNTRRPRSERDRVAFKLLALDSSGKHGSHASDVRDLRALWQAYAAAENTGLVVPATLFRLGDKAKKPKSSRDDVDDMSERSKPRTPSERLAKHEILEDLARTLDVLGEWKAAAAASE